MRYAQNTEVSVERSKAEIESLLHRYGADQFMSGWKEGQAAIQFQANGKQIRFILPLPSIKEDRFQKRNRYSEFVDNTPAQAQKLWEQACRQVWRALALVVKAKLEAVETGITTFEEEFYAHIVLPNKKTVFEETHKQVELAYETGKVKNMLEWKD